MASVVRYGFLIGLCVLIGAFHHKSRELELRYAARPVTVPVPAAPSDIAKHIVMHPTVFKTAYTAIHPFDGKAAQINVRIRYPQISGHPDLRIERKLNTLLADWAGVNADHPTEFFDHVADYEITAREFNLLAVTLEDGGIFFGAATGATVNKTLMLNVSNGERYELKDLFRAGYQKRLLELVRDRAFCDIEQTRRADDPGSIPDDQEFYVKGGNLVLVYQRRQLCAGADGPTFVRIDSTSLRPLLNPNGPLGYLL